MNVRSSIVNKQSARASKFLHIAFNQDESCFSCSTENGFKVYNSNPLGCKLTHVFSDSNNCGISYSKMLHRTNYIVLLGGGKRPKYPPNKLVIWDDLKKKESITLKFMSPVREVFISRVYVIVVLISSIEVYQFQPTTVKICPSLNIANYSYCDFVLCQTSMTERRLSNDLNAYTTPTAPALRNSSNNNNNTSRAKGFLAYTSPKIVGQIHIADLSQLKYNERNPDSTQLLPTSIIKAHKSAIRLIRLNKQGTMVATCSKQGTLIRIFSTVNGALLKEFRRGLDRADIYEMAFSPKGTRLAVISDKQTLHIYQIINPSDNNNDSEAKASVQDLNNNKTHILRNYVPQVWKPKYIYSIWSMCSLHLKNPLLRDSLKDNEPDYEFIQDRCKIGWSSGSGRSDSEDENDEDTLILVWRRRGIWEKYVILEKDEEDVGLLDTSPVNNMKSYTINQTLRRDVNQTQAKKKKWELIRESWREL